MKHKNAYEYVVIGGGPAGSTVASYLAKAGRSVLIIEKESFPRPHVGESLLPFCYDIFQDLGVLNDVEERFERKPGVRFNTFHGKRYSTSCFSLHIDGPASQSFHVRRDEFDQLLLQNAQRLGVSVKEQNTVLNVSVEHGGCTVMCRSNEGGPDTEIVTNFVIDASGRSSVLAKKMNAHKPIEGFKRIAFSAHWENATRGHGLDEGLLNIFKLDEPQKKGWVWMIPIAENRISLGVVMDSEHVKKSKEREEGAFEEVLYERELFSSKLISKVLSTATRVTPVDINSNYSYYSEIGYGSRFALVGDAFKFIDPIFATGVFMSMKSAQVLGRALVAGDSLDNVYTKIKEAYDLIERMIRMYYADDGFDLHELEGVEPSDFGRSESVFGLIHGLLAGDLFEKGNHYNEFFDALQNPKTLAKYHFLTRKPSSDSSCEYS
ncbi:tryptophan 7-halogenase [Flavobacteriales bacterium]|nr:tryptophan 7-halogenase [Flavobacteriales bacterium]